MTRHDVVVIGGSLAGAACVRELVRLGIDAVAFERDRFPRAKVCGGFVSPGGVECLQRLGVLEQVRAAGAVDVSSAKVQVESSEVEIPFERPGLGISRRALDEIVARAATVEHRAVNRVERGDGGFLVDGVRCAVVIDAAGKSSRFTRRQTVDEFGIQYTEKAARGGVLSFRFFKDGYGGGVSIEGGLSNWCFLIKRDVLPKYLSREDCLVTGPLAYDKLPGDFIAVGDAAGMVDPFCGDGMRHALDTGMLAARVVARGIRTRASYEQMKWEYEAEWERKWMARRALGAAIRRLLSHHKVFSAALRFTPARLLNRLWD